MKPHRVLILDIETAPLLGYLWRPDDSYVPPERLIHDSFLLCWGAKWRGQKRVHTGLLTSDEAVNQDDARIVASLADLIREADVVVAHNARRFDIPMLNNRLLLLGLEPVGKPRLFDTLLLARRTFRLAYNNLDYLGQVLGLGRKEKVGFDVWRRCYQGETAALKRLRRYNQRDVNLLEDVFERLLPYLDGAPRLVDASSQDEMVCPSCGAADEFMVRRGFHRTQASRFQKYQCKLCGRYSRVRVADKDAKLLLHPL